MPITFEQSSRSAAARHCLSESESESRSSRLLRLLVSLEGHTAGPRPPRRHWRPAASPSSHRDRGQPPRPVTIRVMIVRPTRLRLAGSALKGRVSPQLVSPQQRRPPQPRFREHRDADSDPEGRRAGEHAVSGHSRPTGPGRAAVTRVRGGAGARQCFLLL